MKIPDPVKIGREYLRKRSHLRFVSRVNIPSGSTILDISCGDGDMLWIIRKHVPDCTYHGIDMSEQCIEKAKKWCSWGTFSVARAESLPYENGTFSAVVCCMSFHHYDQPAKVFEEAARVLTPGGTFYLIDSIPAHRLAQMYHNWDGCGEPYHFEKYYLKKEIGNLGKKAGLHIVDAKRLRPLSNIWIITMRGGTKQMQLVDSEYCA